MYKANSSPKINKKKTGRKLFKRLLPIFMIIPLLMCTTFQMPQNAEAAIVSKVITKVAKKMIKEVTKDSAVNQASKIILEYQMESMIKEAYKIPDGYEGVCFEHATQKCTKPALVKKNLTDLDKKSIGSKVEEILDTKAGMTPFKKFLDWLLPIWAIGLTVSVLQYSNDPDFQQFIDDIAMEALTYLGIIIPIQEAGDPQPTRPTNADLVETYDSNQSNQYTTTRTRAPQLDFSIEPGSQNLKSSVLQIRSTETGFYNHQLRLNGISFLSVDATSFFASSTTAPLGYSIDVIQQGEIVSTTNAPVNTTLTLPAEYRPVINQNLNFFLPYIENNVLYLHVTSTQNSNIYQLRINNPTIDLDNITSVGFYRYSNYYHAQSARLTTTIPRPVTVPLPTPQEIIDYSSPMETTPYKQGSTVYFPSPKTIEYTTPDEKKITPSPTTPGEFIDEEGNVVPEDDVIVSDPKVEPNPDGDIVYTPEPTPENPNPTPEPITPPNETELGHKLPFEFVLALLKVLKATLNFMKIQFLFFATLPFIPEREIPFEMFQAFKDFKPFNFPIYATVQGFAAFTSTFLIFRVIRRMF